MKNKFLRITVVLLLIFSMAGCSSTPKENPDDIIKNYYQSIIDGNYQGAYELLSSDVQSSVKQEDYLLWQSLMSESNKLNEFKFLRNQELKDFTLNGKTFKNVVEYSITNISHDYYEDKDKTDTYKRYIVNDNGNWKMMYEDLDVKTNISYAYHDLGYLYLDGKSKTKDLNQAAIYFSKAIDYNSTNPSLYYSLSSAYLLLNRNDEALEKIMSCIENAGEEKEILSDAYNIKGNIYENKFDRKNAIESYKKAIEINPSNEYAKTNLARLQD